MSNKTILQTNNNKISGNNATILSVIDTVNNLPKKGSEIPTKGIVINKFNSSGYIEDLTIVGLTTIPQAYMRAASTAALNYASVLSLGLKRIVVEDSVTTIGAEAFCYLVKLEALILPNSVTSIGEAVFGNLPELQTITLSDNITNIPTNTFYQCYKLALTTLPSGITSIGNYAFYNCYKLALTDLPSSLTSIGTYGFCGCKNINTLTINSSSTLTINNYAFINCTNLTTLIFPNVTSVPTIASSTIFNSSGITASTGNIYVPDNLVDAFKSATNWSTYATRIKAISLLG